MKNNLSLFIHYHPKFFQNKVSWGKPEEAGLALSIAQKCSWKKYAGEKLDTTEPCVALWTQTAQFILKRMRPLTASAGLTSNWVTLVHLPKVEAGCKNVTPKSTCTLEKKDVKKNIFTLLSSQPAHLQESPELCFFLVTSLSFCLWQPSKFDCVVGELVTSVPWLLFRVYKALTWQQWYEGESVHPPGRKQLYYMCVSW